LVSGVFCWKTTIHAHKIIAILVELDTLNGVQYQQTLKRHILARDASFEPSSMKIS